MHQWQLLVYSKIKGDDENHRLFVYLIYKIIFIMKYILLINISNDGKIYNLEILCFIIESSNR